MERKVEIEGKEIPVKVTGNTPRSYRINFGRDVFKDLDTLNKAYKKEGVGADFSCLEMLFYTMAKQANGSIGTIDEFLDGFDSPLSIALNMGAILEVWNESLGTLSNAKNQRTQ